MMHRRFVVFILVLSAVVSEIPVRSEETVQNGTALTPEDTKLLASAKADGDAAVLRRIARTLGSQKLITAFYTGTRSERLTALDAAAYVDAPLAVLPALAALLSASERQTASRTAGTFLKILTNPETAALVRSDIIPGQAAQLISQLAPVAADPRLDADVRVTALRGAQFFSSSATVESIAWSLPLIDDPEPAVRQTAAGIQYVPLSKDAVLKLAAMATKDAVPSMRGFASAILCENALAHGVKEPSADLTSLLTGIVKDPAVPAVSMAGLFSCLKRFPSGERRRAVLDAAKGNINPEVAKFLEGIKAAGSD